MYIVIVGGGQIGYYLTKDLLEMGYEVTLLDWNADVVDRLSYEIGESVLLGTGTSIDGLEIAGASRADVLIAVTGDDEDNLVACQLGAKYFNIPKTIGKISNPKNEELFRKLDIGTTMSGTSAIVDEVESHVAKKCMLKLLEFNHHETILFEAELFKDAPVVGKRIKDIELPYACTIVSILHGAEVVYPKDDTVFTENDIVLVVTSHREQSNVRKILIGDPGVQ
jgi:trk system potassium uptake protein TrkA